MSASRLAFLSASAAASLALPAVAATSGSGSATILALYKKPADPAAFDRYYADHHAPLAKTLPGLQSFTLSKGLTAKDPYYQVATLTFASIGALQSALASAQGTAVVADLKNFAQAGVDVMTFETVPA